MFTPLPNGNLRLDADFSVPVWEDQGISLQITVPTGFVSDGASIPRFFWPFIGPPMGSAHLIPAVVHDYLCSKATTYPQRVMGDAIFFAMLREYRISYWKRATMYLAVRWFGRFVWSRQHAKK